MGCGEDNNTGKGKFLVEVHQQKTQVFSLASSKRVMMEIELRQFVFIHVLIIAYSSHSSIPKSQAATLRILVNVLHMAIWAAVGRDREVHTDAHSVHQAVVEALLCGGGVADAVEVDEGEAARVSREAVPDHLHLVHVPITAEDHPELALICVKIHPEHAQAVGGLWVLTAVIETAEAVAAFDKMLVSIAVAVVVVARS